MAAMVTKPQLNERSKFLRNLLFWLLLLPVVMCSLFLCGQMALWFGSTDQAVDTRSLIKANYQPWQFQEVPAIDVAALQQDVVNEQGSAARIPASTLESGDFWPKLSATPVILAGPVETFTPTEPGLITVKTPTPTSTTVPPTSTPTKTFTPTSVIATIQATETSTPVRTTTPTSTLRVATNTPTPTSIPPSTQTPVIGTPTPTRTPVIIHVTYTFTPTPTQADATDTPTPTITSTPTDTPTPTNTPTPTATFTPTATPTSTGTPTPTPTFTFTPTPTDTAPPAYMPILPIAENSFADPVGTDSCQGYFGYKNDNAYNVTIDKGAYNQIIGSYTAIYPIAPYTGNDLPTLFYSGHVVAFSIIWNTGGAISWDLDGRTATYAWCR